MQVVQYDYDKFAPVIGIHVEIGEDTLLFRGFNPSRLPITSVPTFFGPQYVAAGYGTLPNRTVGMFVTRRSLKLYDVRYLMMLLQGVLVGRVANPAGVEQSDVMEVMQSLAISFGLTSFKTQIDMVKRRYRDSLAQVAPNLVSMEDFLKENCAFPPELMDKSLNPFEPRGFRIAETVNDGISITFLKGFFDGHVDGFIAPSMFSPFHVEKTRCTMTPEILLFDPVAAGIEYIDKPANVVIRDAHISEILTARSGLIDLSFGGFRRQWFQGGGEAKKKPKLKHCPNTFFDNVRAGKKRETNTYQRILGIAHSFRTTMLQNDPAMLTDTYFRPHPSIPVSTWINGTGIW